MERSDQLLYECFDWILHTPEYIEWQNGETVGLLWIRGGAGKGKTMMSIGLIEKLSLQFRSTSVVTYFLCRYDDTNLNSIETMLKGLILELVRQQESLKPMLRAQWDLANGSFVDGMSDWHTLSTILITMLSRCPCPKVFIVVDALDECRDDAMANLLRFIVRVGLTRCGQLKWLLTSRPLDSAERMLLAGSNQKLVSLELNDDHISRGVSFYITHKVNELYRLWGSRLPDRNELEDKLAQKAEGTMLWVSLVCKQFETLSREDALARLDDLPPALGALYSRAYQELCGSGTSDDVGCARLLQVMMLAFQPLRLSELHSVADFPGGEQKIDELVERSASFVKKRDDTVEFIHQSAREFLSGLHGRLTSVSKDRMDHYQMAANCLSYMVSHLKKNLLDLPPFGLMDRALVDHTIMPLAGLKYAATFWFRHLEAARRRTKIRTLFSYRGPVYVFLDKHLLNWLECLSLSEQLYSSLGALDTLTSIMVDTLQVSLPLNRGGVLLNDHSSSRSRN